MNNLPEENFSFTLLDYEIEHQGQAVLDIFVDLDLKAGIGTENPFEYPDFVPIADYIDNYLVNYPNETDFWEILNKNLVTDLLTEPIPTPYGVDYNLNEIVDSLTLDIGVQAGSSEINIPRSSVAKGMVQTDTVELTENFSFTLLDYEIEHQGQAVLDIFVDLDLKAGIGTENPFEYPDFVPIADYIDNYLVNYPNETDFWEILNKNLVTDLLTEPIPTPYGVDYNLNEIVDSLTLDIGVQAGSSEINIPRSSVAKGMVQTDTVELTENFSFTLLDYEIEHQGQAVLDIFVDLDLKAGIGTENPFEYPDFVPIADYIDNYLVNYPNETDFWEILNKNLVTDLLTEPIPTPYGVDYNLNEIVDSLTLDIGVQAGSSEINIPRSSKVTQRVEVSTSSTIFGTSGNDNFDTEVPDAQQFIGDNQILFTGSGNDTVDLTFAPGGESSRVDLGSGNDILFGGSNHRIIAGTGEDQIFISQGDGNNIITGGIGEKDQFWLVTDEKNLPTQVNTITDFVLSEDIIGLANTNLNFEDITLIQNNQDTIIKALGQNLAILLSTSARDLSANSFVFA